VCTEVVKPFGTGESLGGIPHIQRSAGTRLKSKQGDGIPTENSRRGAVVSRGRPAAATNPPVQSSQQETGVGTQKARFN